MANFIKPYNDDPFVGHLATPITSSAVTRALLMNLPAYRFGLTPLLRGLEIGLAHGYFLIGPFTKLGPLRNSDIALLSGFLSTVGLILILTFSFQSLTKADDIRDFAIEGMSIGDSALDFFTKNEIDNSQNAKYPNVIKADNLAAGKGVYICNNEQESLTAIEDIFNGKFVELS